MLNTNWRQIRILSANIFILAIAASAQAAKVHGRFTFGGYTSTERFTDNASGSTKNDFLTASGRMYLKVSEMGEDRWEFVSDLRDKHDFFDKLDRERLELRDRNSFQVRQMSVRNPGQNSLLGGSVGRFPILEAGALFVDGAEADIHLHSAWNLAFFGGLNPKPIEQSYLSWNPNHNVYGSFLHFEPKALGWNQNTYISHAYVTQTVSGHVDRNYLFQNILFQWNSLSRFISIAYLDFVPRTKVQTASVTWQQGITSRLTTNLNFLSVDVIEYTRRQGVLERLTPSPYREGSLAINVIPSNNLNIEIGGSSGQRDADHLNKNEYYLGVALPQFPSKRFDMNAKAGGRHNFTSDDTFVRIDTGYFSNKWEFTLAGDFAVQKERDGKILHPSIYEVSASSYISDALFATVSAESAQNEEVRILSAFFKVGYRFGNQLLPPVRDGAPPRGRL